jgi:hypothetical protein
VTSCAAYYLLLAILHLHTSSYSTINLFFTPNNNIPLAAPIQTEKGLLILFIFIYIIFFIQLIYYPMKLFGFLSLRSVITELIKVVRRKLHRPAIPSQLRSLRKKSRYFSFFIITIAFNYIKRRMITPHIFLRFLKRIRSFTMHAAIASMTFL